MRNIYLFGESGAGKDTVAYYVAKQYGYEAYALGDGPKAEHQRWFGVKPTKADRADVIEIAETYKRLYGADVWCRETSALANTFAAMWKCPILISDGRFLAEYDYFVKQRGYVPVYLFADYDVRMRRLLERDGVDQRAVLAGREDEVRVMRGYAEYVLVNNDAGLDALTYQVDAMLARLEGIHAGT